MEDFLREIEGLSIFPTRRLLRGFQGNHKSRNIGQSMDFYGHREYILGDDIRKIDWKAYGRTEGIYIKDFLEEMQMDVNILLDISASMDYGNPNKWEVSKLITLGLSYLTLKQTDRLTVCGFNETLEPFCRGIQGMDWMYRIKSKLDFIDVHGKTNFDSILQIENYNPGMTFIISDLFGKNIENALDLLCSKGQDIVVIQVLAQSEISPDFCHELKLIDMETGDVRFIDMNDRVKKVYKSKIQNFIDTQKKLCCARQVKHVLAFTDVYPAKIMAEILGGV